MRETTLRTYVGKNVQIKLRGEPRELGPGKLEEITKREEIGDTTHVGLPLFRFHVPAHLGDPRQPQSIKQVILPVDFEAEDVVWVSEGPKNADGEQLVQPLPGNRTPGGLVIGGH